MKQRPWKENEIQIELFKIMDEISKLMKRYSVLKCEYENNFSKFHQEELLKEYLKEKVKGTKLNSYQIISIKISAYLKNRGIPTKAKEIFCYLSEKENISLTYQNLQSNYLYRMHNDRKVNVERAYRGYWQYRLK